MCMRVTCKDCNKYTWAGCGRHIDQALAGLSKDQICTCKEKAQQKPKEDL
ncbi:hypothetical protein K450DRAFT_241914 [Umbelopsis ramanniana AG]|uniref:Uncharacterized protein n=1 Tax=Umbelopsis ramanniana AG TaxID=1314678 RepID=A0AAD5HCS4_UMBRA|nr:uncharacterized protein K450DRAFT_241914 [Umbelopsis ramanniana AG]KAI8579392.1 hypothetical protein K450DRAFT_241914 [Umbelopsis ramanniana AG]